MKTCWLFYKSKYCQWWTDQSHVLSGGVTLVHSDVYNKTHNDDTGKVPYYLRHTISLHFVGLPGPLNSFFAVSPCSS